PRQPVNPRQANAAAIEFFTASAKPLLQPSRHLPAMTAQGSLPAFAPVRSMARVSDCFPARSTILKEQDSKARKAAAEETYPNPAAKSASSSERPRLPLCSLLSLPRLPSFFPLLYLAKAPVLFLRPSTAIDRCVFSLFRFPRNPAAA